MRLRLLFALGIVLGPTLLVSCASNGPTVHFWNGTSHQLRIAYCDNSCTEDQAGKGSIPPGACLDILLESYTGAGPMMKIYDATSAVTYIYVNAAVDEGVYPVVPGQSTEADARSYPAQPVAHSCQ